MEAADLWLLTCGYFYQRLRSGTTHPVDNAATPNRVPNANNMMNRSVQENHLLLNADRPITTYRDLFSAASMLSEPETMNIVSARQGRLKRFCNLSIGHKHLIGLLTSKVILGTGLIMAGTLLVFVSGRKQLLSEAQAELLAAERAYILRVDEVEISFQERADTPAIIDAATDYAAEEEVSAASLAAVRPVLRQAIAAQDLEYATLVGQ